jgi:glutathione S-transferase
VRPPDPYVSGVADLGGLPAAASRAGPFLFSAFSLANAMCAPVVSRFRTYGEPAGAAGAWAEMTWGLPVMQR